jgi:hypothetical protein
MPRYKLTKEVKDLYNKTLKKEVKEDTRKCKTSHVHRLAKLIL